MKYVSLGLTSFTLALVAFTSPASAADPTPAPAADPWETRPTTIEDQEAEVLKAPAAVPGAPEPAPVPAPPPRRPVTPPPRRAVQAVDQPVASATVRNGADEDRTALAIELGTNGFASGALEGGLFLGARTSGGIIIGAMLDYRSSSVTIHPGTDTITNASSAVRFGAGARFTFLRSADHRVELVGAVDAGIVYATAETTGISDASASGLTIAAGPGLRFWVHEQIAIGYLARLRFTHLSGDAPALGGSVGDGSASGRDVAFAGTFQILGVF